MGITYVNLDITIIKPHSTKNLKKKVMIKPYETFCIGCASTNACSSFATIEGEDSLSLLHFGSYITHARTTFPREVYSLYTLPL